MIRRVGRRESSLIDGGGEDRQMLGSQDTGTCTRAIYCRRQREGGIGCRRSTLTELPAHGELFRDWDCRRCRRVSSSSQWLVVGGGSRGKMVVASVNGRSRFHPDSHETRCHIGIPEFLRLQLSMFVGKNIIGDQQMYKVVTVVGGGWWMGVCAWHVHFTYMHTYFGSANGGGNALRSNDVARSRPRLGFDCSTQEQDH
ncbi:hypothetical protein BU24DRAFT_53101 [Aaosphaeria arxii CBS 175.79]|uniref:Uncharacterized protein n=1 Tax=Aaosphaeria arxii CBS 175.79 TaxID=1450172 RepID=A0A6A5XDL3_9PLEO|nr:uncharacterized protein BU24DRAFT_53101 [Aaosphaeria arxii CBS 175.79]KAF2011102.1 hypothetical protein BU24DRAFT_53101 [Aaosphaeria arxii CBS 175.79]